MAQAQAKPQIPWGPVMVALVLGAGAAGLAAWQMNLRSLESQVKDKRSLLKKLVLSGGIPPNEEVMDYLQGRQSALDERYQRRVQQVAAPPLTEAAKADPQLYFQQHFHDIQRTLERLATARDLPAPVPLGFPKELPPTDTVPRLLVQLSLMEEAATLVFEQGVTGLASLKVEDPESVQEEGEEGTFLIRLPVRLRLTATLPQLMKTLAAFERVDPLIDVQSIHAQAASSSAASGDADAASSSASEALDVDLVIARYLVLAPQEASTEEPVRATPAKKARSSKKAPR
jgi:hypothetical protein